MDGYVTIGTKLDTSDFDRQINALTEHLKALEEEYNTLANAKPFEGQQEQLRKLGTEIMTTKKKLVSLQTEKEKLNQFGFGKLNQSVNNVGNSIGKVIGKVGKWALAVFGVRSAYNLIRQSVSTISQYDKKMASNIEYIRYAIANTLKPIIEWIINAVYKLLSLVGGIIKMFTGKNIFDKSGIKNYNKAVKSGTKATKELKKQLAGFDEMNVLQDQKNNNAGEGTGTPSFDLSVGLDKWKDFDFIEWIKEKLQKVRDWIYSIDWQGLGSKVYQKIKDFFMNQDWVGLVESWAETMGAIFGAKWGFIFGFLKDAWKDIKNYFKEWIDKAHELGGSWVDGIIMGIANAIKDIAVWIYEHVFKPFINGFKKAFGISSPSKVMAEMGGYIVEGFVQGLSNIWAKVKTIIDNLKTNMIKAFTDIWNGIKKVFSTVGTFFKDTFTKAWESVKKVFSSGGKIFSGIKEGIVEAFKTIVNKLIDGINTIVAKPFNALNSTLNTVRDTKVLGKKPFSGLWDKNPIPVPKIPKLARGGIVNNPGAGVLMGNYIAGESGAEAVIPLNDETMDRLGIAIARHMTINATMINQMNGRTISRELKQIMNEENFGYNR